MAALRRSLTLAPIAFLLAMPGALAQSWQLEPGSRIGFTALQQGSPVDGRFETFTAEISFDPDDLGDSRVEVEIDTASITTGHKDRDLTLRSSGFFDVAKWPTARFASEDLTDEGGDTYAAHGQLSIRDVTREVVLPFELTIGADPDAADRLLATATGELSISRLDYGVGQGDWASTKTVGEEVVIKIEIQATRPR
jgi:polyisoprenoid-binding protein YceI